MQENQSPSDQSAQHQLEGILRSNRVIRFFEELPDKEFPFVKCSIYGATKTNELFVRISSGKISFVESLPSRLITPPMEDRIFGMDAWDQEDAFGLAELMWQKYREKLIQNP